MKIITIIWLALITIVCSVLLFTNHVQNKTIYELTEITAGNAQNVEGLVIVLESQQIINDRLITLISTLGRGGKDL